MFRTCTMENERYPKKYGKKRIQRRDVEDTRRRYSENNDRGNYKKAMKDTVRKYGGQGKDKENLERHKLGNKTF